MTDCWLKCTTMVYKKQTCTAQHKQHILKEAKPISAAVFAYCTLTLHRAIGVLNCVFRAY